MKLTVHLFGMLLALVLLNVALVAQTVKINELYSRGVPGDLDWIEVYNPSSSPLDISGYKIYDNGGQAGSKPKKEFPAGSIIPAMGFLVIVVDDDAESGFGLSSGGDEVWLEDPSGTVIDYIAIPAMETTQSYGRYPDGTENWQLLNTITRGTANMPACGSLTVAAGPSRTSGPRAPMPRPGCSFRIPRPAAGCMRCPSSTTSATR